MSMEETAKNVTTAGTPVVLSSTVLQVRAAVIQAKVTNTGYIYLGPQGVDNSGDKGTALEAGQAYVLSPEGSADLYNLNELWIDADNNGEGVTITFFRK